MALDDSSYEETFARSYTTTIMHYPSLCQTDEFAEKVVLILQIIM